MESVAEATPLHWIMPFAALLGCIALLPLAAPHFWESNRNKALVAALFAVPTAAYLIGSDPAALMHAATEYVSFITLLGSLYVITGGIHVSGDLLATPRNNTLLLGAGGLLANLVGTTGASMLLIRVFLSTNSERRQVAHLPVFFILVVSNCAGLLTPLGDPPLFLGYLRGVPFGWTASALWPFWLVAIGYLLLVFYQVDRRAFSREQPIDIALDKARLMPVGVHGKRQLFLLALVIGADFLPTPVPRVHHGRIALSASSRSPARHAASTSSPTHRSWRWRCCSSASSSRWCLPDHCCRREAARSV